MARRSNPRRRGATLIEALVATLILAVGIMGLMSMAATVYQMTMRTDSNGVGYSIARRTLEELRAGGFFARPDGSTTYYFDAAGANRTTDDVDWAAYRLVLTLSSSAYQVSSNGVVTPSPQALRTADIQVFRMSDGMLMLRTGTHLTRGGL